MLLTPHESEKLLIYVAADLAGKRRRQGCALMCRNPSTPPSSSPQYPFSPVLR